MYILVHYMQCGHRRIEKLGNFDLSDFLEYEYLNCFDWSLQLGINVTFVCYGQQASTLWCICKVSRSKAFRIRTRRCLKILLIVSLDFKFRSRSTSCAYLKGLYPRNTHTIPSFTITGLLVLEKKFKMLNCLATQFTLQDTHQQINNIGHLESLAQVT